jgi:thiol:disulfide interchange protein
MKARTWLVGLALLAAVAVGCHKESPAPAHAKVDEPFQDLSFDDALRQARDDGKLVMIDFSAEWCGWCHELDATTWKDSRVRDWVREHVVPIKIDVDEEQELAGRYRVRGLPTILFLKPDGSVVHRVGGYVDADGFFTEVADLAGKKPG